MGQLDFTTFHYQKWSILRRLALLDMQVMSNKSPLPSLVTDPARLAALHNYGILDTPAEQGFDDIVQLAGLLCEAPVALVSLVASDRQWFKARIGFPPCETDLNSSVCAYALAEPDLLIIPDLAADPRTRTNPLVCEDPHIRFYAGAPLRTEAGHVLGSLCVIDNTPRPAGLTLNQSEGLRALAREVISQLELRRVLRDHEALLTEQRRIETLLRSKTEQLAASEAYWRGLFERMREGLIIGEIIKDDIGRVTDWRYLEVNRAWNELVGATKAVGRTVREVFPGIEEEWIRDPGYVVESGETVTFTRQVGELGRWYEGRISPLGRDMFVILFLDVTDRILTTEAMKRSAERKAALARLGDHLRTAMSADAMGYIVGAIVGPELGAVQAGYASIDIASERVEVDSTWCASDAPSLAGARNFRDYGSFIEDLKGGCIVVVSNVCEDERTREQLEAFHALRIGAFINAPVVEHGELVAVLLVTFDGPRTVTREEEDFLRSAVDRTRSGIARLRAEERQGVLNEEISHRLKNSMAMIQALANQTLKDVTDRNAVNAFEQRLMALSTAHDVLLRTDWEAADLAEVVERVLDTAGTKGSYDSSGPTVKLGARAALSTSLLLHELATNARKYGSLTSAAGKIKVTWHIETENGVEELVLAWLELGGPPAVEPTRKGFGSRLLRMGLVGAGGSHVNYRESGFEATFRAPRTQVERA